MKIFSIVFFLIIFLNNHSFSQEEIVFINVNYIFKESISGKKANELVNDKIRLIESDINEFSKRINSEREKLINQKNILSEENYAKEIKLIDSRIVKFNNSIELKNNEVSELRKKIRSIFISELNKILSDYASKNSIKLILEQDNVLIGSNKLNISDKILEMINSKKIELID